MCRADTVGILVQTYKSPRIKRSKCQSAISNMSGARQMASWTDSGKDRTTKPALPHNIIRQVRQQYDCGYIQFIHTIQGHTEKQRVLTMQHHA